MQFSEWSIVGGNSSGALFGNTWIGHLALEPKVARLVARTKGGQTNPNPTSIKRNKQTAVRLGQSSCKKAHKQLSSSVLLRRQEERILHVTTPRGVLTDVVLTILAWFG